ncbi:MAG: hypothetical protein ABSH09_18790, partial [Bryobacteraceae bacterium]
AATGTPALTPAFVSFMSQAVQFSKALYGDAGTDPILKYTVRPHSVSGQMDAYIFTADGASTTLKSDQQGNLTWSGASTKFGLVIKVAGRGDQSGAPTDGLWAPFHFFRDADSSIPNGSAAKFLFKPHVGTRPITDGKDQPLVYEIQAPAVFNTNIWKQVRCVSNPAR